MKQAIPSALISTDSAFREVLAQTLGEQGRGIALGVEIAVPFIQIGDVQLRQLREASPEVIFIDLEKDPEVGIKLALFLADQQPNRQFVAAGPVLAPELLMQAMRAGITEYLPKPVTREALLPALERMERKLGFAAGGSGAREPGKVMTFFSARGGSGATTVATNLAIHLHQLTGKKVLLVDLDLELGELALFLGMQPRFNLVDLVRNLHRMDAELLTSYTEAHKSGVYLLASPYQSDKVEVVQGDQIRSILQFLKQHYDYVVVDTPRSLGPVTLTAFEQSDQIYLVTQADVPSLRNIKRCMPLLDKTTGGHTKDRVRLVLNRHNASGNEIGPEEVERTLGLNIFWKLGNDYETVIRSINTGEPLILGAKGSAFAKDLKGLAHELSGLGAVTNGKKGGLLSFRRFFGGANAKEMAHE